MPEAPMPYQISATGPGKPVSFRCAISQAALEKALELLCQPADDVRIIVGGKNYSPLRVAEEPL